KGGGIVLAAFRAVRKRHPDALLTIVGDRPRRAALEPGVTCTGFLRKEIPDEYRLFQDILGRVRALVNATRCDTCSVLLIEAGYCGCPVISTRKFATPEIVDDGHTGLLLDDVSHSSVASAMNWMLEHTGEYQEMRQAAWNKTRSQHSKTQFEARLRFYLNQVISADRMLVL